MWLNNSVHSMLGGGCYGGPLATEPAVAAALLEQLETIARRRGASYVEVTACPYLRCEELKALLAERGYGRREDRDKAPLLFYLDLGDFEKDIWMGRFKAQTRKQVRKAKKEGVTVLRDAWDRFGEYYDLLAETYARLNAGPTDRQVFLDEHARLRDRARLHLAVYRGEVIAGMTSFLSRDTWYLIGNASRGDRLAKLYPNNLLYAETIQEACQLGFARCDIGSTRPDSSHAYFKQSKLGASSVPIETFVKVLSPWRYQLRRKTMRPRIAVRRVLWGKLFPGERAQRLSPRTRKMLEWF